MSFEKMNNLFADGIPFFFIISFDESEMEVLPLSSTLSSGILFSTGQMQNFTEEHRHHAKISWQKKPVDFQEYDRQFRFVKKQIYAGNTYLINLTFSTPVQTDHDLLSLFFSGHAPYKLFYKDRFIHFSPEPFVKITGDCIASFPMKGTIDATMPHAKERLLYDAKEINEQYIIVDLIRNDLSIVAKGVKVEDFRYIEKIVTNEKELWTVSSKISGILRKEYKNKPGDIFQKLLPAGSICGAPKRKTLEIIAETETHPRGFYTGVWGIFDGKKIDSCVIIRYLEKVKNHYFYKSGGGITAKSNASSEYQEMIDKIYVPVY